MEGAEKTSCYESYSFVWLVWTMEGAEKTSCYESYSFVWLVWTMEGAEKTSCYESYSFVWLVWTMEGAEKTSCYESYSFVSGRLRWTASVLRQRPARVDGGSVSGLWVCCTPISRRIHPGVLLLWLDLWRHYERWRHLTRSESSTPNSCFWLLATCQGLVGDS